MPAFFAPHIISSKGQQHNTRPSVGRFAFTYPDARNERFHFLWALSSTRIVGPDNAPVPRPPAQIAARDDSPSGPASEANLCRRSFTSPHIPPLPMLVIPRVPTDLCGSSQDPNRALDLDRTNQRKLARRRGGGAPPDRLPSMRRVGRGGCVARQGKICFGGCPIFRALGTDAGCCKTPGTQRPDRLREEQGFSLHAGS
ncbi:hypothetical protein PHLGIDRAFT_446165 [Phlebiopsis gigantea 11061_1 CR5-6]|uniref:Uncharacterized protein n=1 Tax=Phlebiopsis gigantea (strain 11061_1 CR5-6) TaxID=745531 RepID=A0A0C3S7K8_PHLG1|nr:hypothetical protein PHLGIDRAFT_446165 [Phlebiopsis gigantea 11061_1 CR5-6]